MNVEDQIKTSANMPIRQRTLIHLLLLSDKITKDMTQSLKPFDVSLQQFNVLRILRGQQGKPANLSTINSRMISKMSNTTRLIDKLLKKGFVERIICPSNRRKIEISITEIGQRMLLKMDAVIAETENKLLINLTNEELKTLNSICDKI